MPFERVVSKFEGAQDQVLYNEGGHEYIRGRHIQRSTRSNTELPCWVGDYVLLFCNERENTVVCEPLPGDGKYSRQIRRPLVVNEACDWREKRPSGVESDSRTGVGRPCTLTSLYTRGNSNNMSRAFIHGKMYSRECKSDSLLRYRSRRLLCITIRILMSSSIRIFATPLSCEYIWTAA